MGFIEKNMEKGKFFKKNPLLITLFGNQQGKAVCLVENG